MAVFCGVDELSFVVRRGDMQACYYSPAVETCVDDFVLLTAF